MTTVVQRSTGLRILGIATRITTYTASPRRHRLLCAWARAANCDRVHAHHHLHGLPKAPHGIPDGPNGSQNGPVRNPRWSRMGPQMIHFESIWSPCLSPVMSPF